MCVMVTIFLFVCVYCVLLEHPSWLSRVPSQGKPQSCRGTGSRGRNHQIMANNFRPLGFYRRQDLWRGSAVCFKSTRLGVNRPEFYSQRHYQQVVGLGIHPQLLELCTQQGFNKIVEWINMRELNKSVFPNGMCEDPLGLEGGRGTGRLWTPHVLPHLAPSHSHLPTVVIFM